MKITAANYRYLVDLLYLGDWLMHAHEVVDNPVAAPHRALFNEVMNLFESMDGQGWLIKDVDSAQYFPTRDYETELILVVAM